MRAEGMKRQLDTENELWDVDMSCWGCNSLKHAASPLDLGSLRTCLKDPTVENANSLPVVSLAGLRNGMRTSTDCVGSGFYFRVLKSKAVAASALLCPPSADARSIQSSYRL